MKRTIKLRSNLVTFALTISVCLTPWTDTSSAQVPTHIWDLGIGGTSGDRAYAVASDGFGNTFITGTFAGTVNFGGGNFTAGSADIFLAKYDASGNHIWSQQFGGTSTDEGWGLATDSAGNVLVIGVFSNTVSFGDDGVTSAGSRDIFLAKYDPNGAYLWSRTFGGTSSDHGYSVAVDDSDNVVITGFFKVEADFGGGDLVEAGLGDVFVAKYASDGTYLWANRYGGSKGDIGREVAFDSAGNVLLTGYSEGTADFGGGWLTSFGGVDIFLAKYDANGAHQWSKRFGNVNNCYGYDVVADAADNVIFTGSFIGTVDFEGGPLASTFHADIALAKYDPSGNHVWSEHIGQPSSSGGYVIPYGLDVDAAGNTVLTGRFSKTIDFGGGDITATGNNSDIFLASYASDGSHRWSTKFGSGMQDEGQDVVFDPFGHVAVTGLWTSLIDLGSGNKTGAGGNDVFVAKYGPDAATGIPIVERRDGLSVTAYPNPFNPETTIHYALPGAGHVEVAVYDVRGARVAMLVDDERGAGSHATLWNGRDARGVVVASGVYFARVTSGGKSQSHKIVLAK